MVILRSVEPGSCGIGITSSRSAKPPAVGWQAAQRMPQRVPRQAGMRPVTRRGPVAASNPWYGSARPADGPPDAQLLGDGARRTGAPQYAAAATGGFFSCAFAPVPSARPV